MAVLTTKSLGFKLTVRIEPLLRSKNRGQHRCTETPSGKVSRTHSHTILISPALYGEELTEVVAHECCHLFFAIREYIKVGEETEATVFGQLVKWIAAEFRKEK
jgi:hypothetical protein